MWTRFLTGVSLPWCNKETVLQVNHQQNKYWLTCNWFLLHLWLILWSSRHLQDLLLKMTRGRELLTTSPNEMERKDLWVTWITFSLLWQVILCLFLPDLSQQRKGNPCHAVNWHSIRFHFCLQLSYVVKPNEWLTGWQESDLCYLLVTINHSIFLSSVEISSWMVDTQA